MEGSSHETLMDRSVRQQVVVPGVLVALIFMPFMMRSWAPLWVALTWDGIYLLVSVFGLANPFRLSTQQLDRAWSLMVGTSFALLPITAAVFGDFDEHFMATALLLIIYKAVALGMLPYLQLKVWWAPLFIAATGQIVPMILHGKIVLALAYLGVTAALLRVGAENAKRSRLLVTRRVEAEEETAHARYLASHDALTNVLNRRGIESEIQRVASGPSTLVMVDADHFKFINDTAGHEAGDRVLTQLAGALQERFGPRWQVGRLGGDEFVAVAGGTHEVPADRAAPVLCDLGHADAFDVAVGLSAGVVVTPQGSTVDQMLGQAGYAMREAKRRELAVVHFQGRLRRRWERGIEVAQALAHPDSDNSVLSFGQLIVQGENRDVVGFELLARWRRDDGSIVAPSEFLPLLRDHGMLPTLNRQMLADGVRLAALFNHIPDAPFVSVNVSASDLGNQDLVGQVKALLRRHEVGPNRLMIEITETEHLWRRAWQQAARELRAMGVLLAVDDFGAGYSSIDRLASLPVTHLKFDRTFADQVDGPFGEVIQGIVRFSAKTGVKIVAEGIETEHQRDAMALVGVDTWQGFLFSRPQPAEVLALATAQGLDPHLHPSARPAVR